MLQPQFGLAPISIQIYSKFDSDFLQDLLQAQFKDCLKLNSDLLQPQFNRLAPCSIQIQTCSKYDLSLLQIRFRLGPTPV